MTTVKTVLTSKATVAVLGLLAFAALFLPRLAGHPVPTVPLILFFTGLIALGLANLVRAPKTTARKR